MSTFRVIVSTRLTIDQVAELDRVRGKAKRSDAARELIMAALNTRHEFVMFSKSINKCAKCNQPDDSIMHLTFIEQDQAAYRDILGLEAARVDGHAEG